MRSKLLAVVTAAALVGASLIPARGPALPAAPPARSPQAGSLAAVAAG